MPPDPTHPRRPLITTPGGCGHCHAHQALTEAEPNIYILSIYHDATCPEYHRLRLETTEDDDE